MYLVPTEKVWERLQEVQSRIDQLERDDPTCDLLQDLYDVEYNLQMELYARDE